MPILDVKCEEHGVQEILVKDTTEVVVCPVCGKECVRVYSSSDGARFVLKGKGFYQTAYGTGPTRMC